MRGYLFMHSLVKFNNFNNYFGCFNFISLVGSGESSKNDNINGFDVLIFIFYLGVLSPCLNTATTDLNSEFCSLPSKSFELGLKEFL